MGIFKQMGLKFAMNLFQFTGWVLVLALAFNMPADFGSEYIHGAVYIARVVQIFQITDFYTAGFSVERFFQILGRLSAVYLFIHYCDLPSFLVLCVWSLSEIIRYLYYFLKYLPLVEWLRYTAFLVLYPIGFGCEALLAQKSIDLWKKEGKHPKLIVWARIHQIAGGLAFVYLYFYMLKQRSKRLNEKGKTKRDEVEGESEVKKKGTKEESKKSEVRKGEEEKTSEADTDKAKQRTVESEANSKKNKKESSK